MHGCVINLGMAFSTTRSRRFNYVQDVGSIWKEEDLLTKGIDSAIRLEEMWKESRDTVKNGDYDTGTSSKHPTKGLKTGRLKS